MLSNLIQKQQPEEKGAFAAGSGHVQEDVALQEQPLSSRLLDQRRANMYSWIASAVIMFLLAASVASYFLYRAEREAIAFRLDAIMRAPLKTQLKQRFLGLEKKFVDTSSANEIRLQAIDQRLTGNHQAQEQKLQDMGQRLVQMHEPHEHRLQRVEQRLARQQQPDGRRLQAIENRLVQISARMDDWAAVVADLSNNDESVAAVNAATLAEPPAARPVEPVVVARNNVVLQHPQSLPEAPQDKQQRGSDTPAVQGDQGNWVINIGSYLHKKTAAGKLAEFRQQGVTAELVTAEVRGKTMFRIQVPGFASMSEANSDASRVQEKLGLEETWVRRR